MMTRPRPPPEGCGSGAVFGETFRFMAPAYRDIVQRTGRRNLRPTSSLIDHRLLPRAERELFQAEIVRFHLEDLNLLAERRRARRRAAAPADRARVAAI